MKLTAKTFSKVGLSVGVCWLASTYSAEASIFPKAPQPLMQSPLQEIVREVQKQLASLELYVDEIIGDRFDALSERVQADIGAIVEDAKGQLGIPDPVETRLALEEAIESENPSYDAEWAATEVDRQLARAQAAETLSKRGQRLQAEQLERIQTAVKTVNGLGETAQQDTATQDVMKRLAAQNTEIGALLGSMHAERQRSQRTQELQNLQLSNISRTLDSQTRAKNAETIGAGFQVMRTAGFGRLF